MITTLGQATKKAPSHKSGRGANAHRGTTRIFSSKPTLCQAITVPYRIGLQAAALARSAPKGNAQLKDYAPLSAMWHSL